MGQPSNLGSLLFADESSFGESSTTFDERLPIVSPVSLEGLTQEMVPVDVQTQFQNEGALMMRGTQSGEITISLYLAGHGSATSGDVTATSVEKFIGNVLGTYETDNDGGTVSGTTSTTVFAETTVDTMTDGSLIRLGSLGDSKGGGQFYACTENSGTITLLTALPAQVAASDVIYAPVLLHTQEAPTTGTTPQSYRFCIQTANQQYRCHGCYPTSISFTGLNAGEIPMANITMAVSRWAVHPHSSEAFPTSTSHVTHTPSPNAAGSFFFQTLGTATRATYTIREFNLNIDYQTVALRGPGATDGFQDIVGCRRMRSQASFDFVIDSEANGTTTFDTLWNTAEGSATFKHCLYTLSAGRDGACIGMYFPKCQIVGARPTQFDMDGINRQRISCRAVTQTGKSTALERANFILAMG